MATRTDHGIGITSERAARSFRSSAQRLATVGRSRIGGPSPIPVGGASYGTLAAKLGTAILSEREQRAQNLRDEREAQQQEDYNTLRIRELRQKLDRPNQGLVPVTFNGHTYNVTPAQALINDRLTADKKPTPERTVEVPKGNIEGLPPGEYPSSRYHGMVSTVLQNRRLTDQRRYLSAQGRAILDQARPIKEQIERQIQVNTGAFAPALNRWYSGALSGDPASIRALGLNPDENFVALRTTSPSAYRGMLDKAREALLKTHIDNWRGYLMQQHAPELQRIKQEHEAFVERMGLIQAAPAQQPAPATPAQAEPAEEPDLHQQYLDALSGDW